jgi:hypothetical protein
LHCEDLAVVGFHLLFQSLTQWWVMWSESIGMQMMNLAHYCTLIHSQWTMVMTHDSHDILVAESAPFLFVAASSHSTTRTCSQAWGG